MTKGGVFDQRNYIHLEYLWEPSADDRCTMSWSTSIVHGTGLKGIMGTSSLPEYARMI